MSSHERAFTTPDATVWSGFAPPPDAASPVSQEDLPGSIGKYKVLKRLSAGAMGMVYQCCQPGLDRLVAVKVMIAERGFQPKPCRSRSTTSRNIPVVL
jgi:hypothetical protein